MFGVVAVFLVVAAVTFDPARAQGLDGALRKLAATPLGPWLLVAVALGLVVFGIYSWCFYAGARSSQRRSTWTPRG